MKNYQELTLIPDAEISLNFLWHKVYLQIHLALVEAQTPNGRSPIGVSFPNYRNDTERKTLGNKLRLFSPDFTTLENLDLKRWLQRLEDYVHIVSIKSVPQEVESHACFYRIQPRKTNAEKAANTAKRLGIDYQQALQKLQGRDESQSRAPFILMKSLSGQHHYRLIIGKKQVTPETLDNQQGDFNTYGLSAYTPVPIF